MLRDRGFLVDPEMEIDADFQSFTMSYEATTPAVFNAIYEHRETGEKVKTRFDSPDKVTGTELKEWIAAMQNDRIHHVIFILKEGIFTPNARRNIDKLRAKGFYIECFEQKEVLINITEHSLVPKHEPLSKESKEELLNRYHITDTQLPRIFKTDPVCRYLGVEPGTVLKITRKSETSGRYVTYRIVC